VTFLNFSRQRGDGAGGGNAGEQKHVPGGARFPEPQGANFTKRGGPRRSPTTSFFRARPLVPRCSNADGPIERAPRNRTRFGPCRTGGEKTDRGSCGHEDSFAADILFRARGGAGPCGQDPRGGKPSGHARERGRNLERRAKGVLSFPDLPRRQLYGPGDSGIYPRAAAGGSERGRGPSVTTAKKPSFPRNLCPRGLGRSFGTIFFGPRDCNQKR